MRSTTISTVFIYIYLIFILSCAKEAVEIEEWPGMKTWEIARALSYKYENTSSRSERLNIARKGIEFAEKCIKETPDEPACYYYRAVNTGLYYKSKVVGYQSGIKQMIEDCNKIIELEPSFEYGGAYRMLGMIYTELPHTSVRPDSIVKDTDKAIEYLRTATKIAPDYPENYIALSKAYLEAKEMKESSSALKRAKNLLPNWVDHIDYPSWKKEAQKIAKELR